MEVSMEKEKETQQIRSKKGGFRTMPFIISNEIFEKVANVGLHVNMIVYLTREYHYDAATGATIIFLWNALSNLLPIFGAFLSDSYLGRFCVITYGTLFELFGLIVLWFTAIFHRARPPHCKLFVEACAAPSTGQVLFLVSSLALLAIGAGGIRPCSLAFAAYQINNPENPKNDSIMKSFFNWYYVSAGVSVALSATFIVYVQIKTGWVVGFGITVGLMLFSTFMFFLGSPLYVKPKAEKNLLTGMAQVAVAAWKNRHLPLPPKGSRDWYFKDGPKLVEPTDKLRLLNKACIINNREKELDSKGMPIEPWNLCTVRQVEELKVLIRVMPIWSTGFLVSVIIAQHSFLVFQAGTMDRHLLFNFKIPAPNITVFSIISMTIWITIYDRILVPLFSKSKNPRIRGGFTLKQRMGIGLALTILATAVASRVERKRRNLAIEHGSMGNPKGVVPMSAWWLVPQHCIAGLAEGFNIIAQIEFYYTQFPKSMSSIAVAFCEFGWGMGQVMAAVIVQIVKVVTQRGGRQYWLASNPNNGHYDYYYGLITILGVINLLYFFLCCWAYRTSQDINNWDDEFDTKLQSKKEVDPK